VLGLVCNCIDFYTPIKTFIKIFLNVVFLQKFNCLFCYTLEMDKQKAITLAGSQSELARILGIHRTAVHQWKKIPKGRIYQLMFLRPQWFVE
jgi:predicted transcriptional regulator